MLRKSIDRRNGSVNSIKTIKYWLVASGKWQVASGRLLLQMVLLSRLFVNHLFEKFFIEKLFKTQS